MPSSMVMTAPVTVSSMSSMWPVMAVCAVACVMAPVMPC